MNNARTYLIAGLMAACGLAVLLCWGLSAASLKVFSVAEFLEASRLRSGGGPGQPEIVPVGGQDYGQVYGQVYGRIARVDAGPSRGLTLADWEDPQKKLIVSMESGYRGPALSSLQAGQDVFVTGKLGQDRLFFEADELIAGCPSKYEVRRPDLLPELLPAPMPDSPPNPLQKPPPQSRARQDVAPAQRLPERRAESPAPENFSSPEAGPGQDASGAETSAPKTLSPEAPGPAISPEKRGPIP